MAPKFAHKQFASPQIRSVTPLLKKFWPLETPLGLPNSFVAKANRAWLKGAGKVSGARISMLLTRRIWL